MSSIRSGRLVTSPRTTNVATWNVECLTDEKLYTLQGIMADHGLRSAPLQAGVQVLRRAGDAR